jgi:DUF2075 family protein
MMSGYGWAGSVQDFVTLDPTSVLESLESHHDSLIGGGGSGSQVEAWRDEIQIMQESLRTCITCNAVAAVWSIILEYELPMEGGRRPDVVVLAGSTVLVLEFKGGMPKPTVPAIDQVNAYARDLAEYHEVTHQYGLGVDERSVIPVLVLTAVEVMGVDVGQTIVVGRSDISEWLAQMATEGSISLVDWLNSAYAPLPSLVSAAKRIFEHEDLPHVRRAKSARIPETVELVSALAEQAESTGRRYLVLVTGVPGAGKTLVGLRAVYEHSSDERVATFLSGNGPLVQVLQDALKSRVFVKDLHAYVRNYGINERQPTEHVVVFDEAQRAWDSDFMFEKKGINRSEPQLLIGAAQRLPEWSCFVGLVGEGQEIHSGEEGGLGQWAAAISELPDADQWEVHCPAQLVDVFDGIAVRAHDLLDLTVSLRSRQAERLHDWVVHLLNGSADLARAVSVDARAEGFVMYLTRHLEFAERYCEQRYGDDPNARYGLLASSHAKVPPEFGVNNSFMATSRMNVAKWYNADPDDAKSCCQLDQPVTEFGCQGLEVDLPIVTWGEDFLWTGSSWQYKPVRRRYPLEDPQEIVRNVYRVLLTRGRDGFIVYVPDDPRFDETADLLIASGLTTLASEQAAIDESLAG